MLETTLNHFDYVIIVVLVSLAAIFIYRRLGEPLSRKV